MTRRSDEAAAKLEALTLAGVDTPPACEGDEMFIADRVQLIPTDMQRMRMVCNRCPLFDMCGDYARTAKPHAGFWAGTLRERHTGRTPECDVEEVTPVDENGDLIEQEVPC
ncbi:WhiB family transcriptional regulator [Microbacterium sp. NPDC086615]|uniref:WhiB family transcriptional regulator n=1 Tax=Microbacterium sp. NPDC086615 TaxID=3154865 RepID=UPI003446A7D4